MRKDTSDPEKAVRARPSRDRIVEAYVDLLQERGSTDITIKELIAHAGSNRSTFYTYFSSVDDIAEQVMEAFFDSFMAANKPYHHGEWVDMGTESGDDSGALDVFSFAHRHRRELTALLNSSLRMRFMDRWVTVILDEYERYDYEFYYFDGTPAPLTDQELGYYLHSIAHSIVAYMEFWADTGFQETPQEMSELMMWQRSISTKKGRRVYRIHRPK